MKNILILSLVALFATGCSYKNESIGLQSYKGGYHGALSKESKSIHLSSVKDIRADKRTIGYIEKKGKKEEALYTNVSFANKYKEGLLSALDIAGFNTDTDANSASMVMEVFIKDIELVYSDKSFDENLKGKIEIEVVIKKGQELIKQNFVQKGGKWIKKSYSSKDVEPFLHTLFSDSINDIVSRLTRD